MPLTSSIPSRKVVHFYDCLLRGIRVDPAWNNKAFALALNDRRMRDGKSPRELPIADANVLPDDDDDQIIGAVRHFPEPKAKTAPVRSVRATPSRRIVASPAPPPVRPPPSVDPIPVCGGGDAPPGGGNAEPPVPLEDNDDDGFVGAASSSTRRPPKKGIVGASRECAGLTEGTSIIWQDYTTPAGQSYPNFTMRCAQCLPRACSRVHGDLDKFKRASGEVEPLAWLHVWERMAQQEGKNHNRINPKQGEVVIYAATHRDALEAMGKFLRGQE